jgi:GNAT superfamily N-acetyltransferase
LKTAYSIASSSVDSSYWQRNYRLANRRRGASGIAAPQQDFSYRIFQMTSPTIRPARADEHDEIARVWMNSWASTGLEAASDSLLVKLCTRLRLEVENGWSLFVADDGGALAAMLALHLPHRYLDQLFVAPEYQGRNLGRQLLAFTRQQMPDEISLRCVRENEKAWRWYEREGFVLETERVEPMTGFTMKYYRWKKEGTLP